MGDDNGIVIVAIVFVRRSCSGREGGKGGKQQTISSFKLEIIIITMIHWRRVFVYPVISFINQTKKKDGVPTND